jgi:hypothetical protein
VAPITVEARALTPVAAPRTARVRLAPRASRAAVPRRAHRAVAPDVPAGAGESVQPTTTH